jgi:hypothetical protein
MVIKSDCSNLKKKKNEGQGYKTGPVREWGEGMERVKEGEYGWCTLYTWMKIEQ